MKFVLVLSAVVACAFASIHFPHILNDEKPTEGLNNTFVPAEMPCAYTINYDSRWVVNGETFEYSGKEASYKNHMMFIVTDKKDNSQTIRLLRRDIQAEGQPVSAALFEIEKDNTEKTCQCALEQYAIPYTVGFSNTSDIFALVHTEWPYESKTSGKWKNVDCDVYHVPLQDSYTFDFYLDKDNRVVGFTAEGANFNVEVSLTYSPITNLNDYRIPKSCGCLDFSDIHKAPSFETDCAIDLDSDVTGIVAIVGVSVLGILAVAVASLLIYTVVKRGKSYNKIEVEMEENPDVPSAKPSENYDAPAL